MEQSSCPSILRRRKDLRTTDRASPRAIHIFPLELIGAVTTGGSSHHADADSRYLADRAAIEGVTSELDPQWLMERIMESSLFVRGRTELFGVLIATLPEGLVGFVSDNQEPHPGYMNEWLDRHHDRLCEYQRQENLH